MFKDIIAQRVVRYYTENPPVASQIGHTMAVAGYTRLIASAMGRSRRECDLQESAAWLHDIGCPDALRKYGNSLPVNQQKEGERIVTEWMNESGAETFPDWNIVLKALAPEERQWLAKVVGAHHQQPSAKALRFEPLFEADLIVNIQEGYYGRNQAQHYYDNMLLTDAGRSLYRALIFNLDSAVQSQAISPSV